MKILITILLFTAGMVKSGWSGQSTLEYYTKDKDWTSKRGIYVENIPEESTPNAITAPWITKIEAPKGYWETIIGEFKTFREKREGDLNCEHNYVNGDSYDPHPNEQCGVYHLSGHCSWHDPVRERICEKCGRLELQQQEIMDNFIETPKSEFEKVKERFEEKK